MRAPIFNHFDLKLIEPKFGSKLTELVLDLNYLKKKELSGSTHPLIFFQLKHIFHLLESIGSARIEGNNTTIAEYIEAKLDQPSKSHQGIQEIQNLEDSMEFIENHIAESEINRIFISELHKMIVKDLVAPPNGEGDKTPGEYRKNNLRIAKSEHLPPDSLLVETYMSDLFNFINNEDGPQYDLIKAAIAHHRFVWIHPFGNGNGRTVRLFTYAMLVKMGFNVNVGRIINPTAVFCSDRNDYYLKLSEADKGTDEGILIWVEYVLRGLKEEIEKIDKLTNYQYLQKQILNPTIENALSRKYITEIEFKILKKAIDNIVISAGDLNDIFIGKHSSEISRQIRKLIDKNMLIKESEGSRKYLISFDNNYLLRSVIKSLGDKGFLPISE